MLPDETKLCDRLHEALHTQSKAVITVSLAASGTPRQRRESDVGRRDAGHIMDVRGASAPGRSWAAPASASS